ncbi:glycosyltransferase [Novosphingobium sp. ST904]|uniref:glycosyltransferase n=1 Tax=Novosphingobium sp. ST904 TaxID=1684385 RepID=UPI001E5C2FE6|nr:glycosyltransferase [Novosphingobium sp. ST904]
MVYSPTSPTPAFAPEGTLVPVPSIRIPGREDYRLGLGLPRRIRAHLSAFAPDIIHVSAPDWTGTAAQSFARDAGIPVVSSLHTRFEKYAAFYGANLLRPAMERHLSRFYRRSNRILVPTPPSPPSSARPVSANGRASGGGASIAASSPLTPATWPGGASSGSRTARSPFSTSAVSFARRGSPNMSHCASG